MTVPEWITIWDGSDEITLIRVEVFDAGPICRAEFTVTAPALEATFTVSPYELRQLHEVIGKACDKLGVLPND